MGSRQLPHRRPDLLQDNPLLREPLRAEHIKPRLLGHWGTSPGLNLVYAQLNRLIRFTGDDVDLDALANESPVGDCRLSGQRAAVPAVLVRSREDVEIGAQTRATLGLR